LLQGGALVKAQSSFSDLIDRAPGFAPAHYGLGVALAMSSRMTEALGPLRHATEIKADYFEAHYNLGNALRALGRHSEAATSYARAIAIQPRFAPAFNHRGLCLLALGRLDDALADFARAIDFDQRYANAYANRGACLIDQNRFHDAAASLRLAVEIEPGNAVYRNDLGAALMGCGSHSAALAAFEQAIESNPCYATAHAGRATALGALGQVAGALDSYRHSLALDSTRAETHSDYASALIKLNRLEEARSSCDRAIALNPELADAYWNRAMANLATGFLPEGWRDYEHRWNKTGARPYQYGHIPRWDGRAPIDGRKLLIWSEQGLGDTLQFCRYVPLIAALGAAVTLAVQPALRGLLTGLDGVSSLIDLGATASGAAYDFQIPLLSLPNAIGTDLSNIPSAVPYLAADVRKVESLRTRMGDSGSGINIGLACSGNAMHKNDASRSIPLDAFKALFGLGRFFLLQNDVRARDECTLSAGAIADMRETLGDFSDTAALIDSLELVITVDTAVAHLAGAMGKPVWVLLPWAPDWRWTLDSPVTPWYPSARLFRQTVPGDWESVIASVGSELSRALRADAGLCRTTDVR